MKTVVIWAILAPNILCANQAELKEYLQDKIDEISLEMAHKTINKDYMQDPEWNYDNGQINAYYDILYQFSYDD